MNICRCHKLVWNKGLAEVSYWIWVKKEKYFYLHLSEKHEASSVSIFIIKKLCFSNLAKLLGRCSQLVTNKADRTKLPMKLTEESGGSWKLIAQYVCMFRKI